MYFYTFFNIEKEWHNLEYAVTWLKENTQNEFNLNELNDTYANFSEFAFGCHSSACHSAILLIDKTVEFSQCLGISSMILIDPVDCLLPNDPNLDCTIKPPKKLNFAIPAFHLMTGLFYFILFFFVFFYLFQFFFGFVFVLDLWLFVAVCPQRQNGSFFCFVFFNAFFENQDWTLCL